MKIISSHDDVIKSGLCENNYFQLSLIFPVGYMDTNKINEYKVIPVITYPEIIRNIQNSKF